MKVGDEIFYRLSRKDVITEVGGAWDRFAIENDGSSLASERVVGQSIFAHVLGEPTRDFVWTMLDGVRKLGRPRTQAYRCDSQGLKRFMEMTIEPERGGGLCLRHRLISTKRFEHSIEVRAANVGTPRSQLTFKCSSCNRLKADRVWHEPEVAFKTAKAPPHLDHGVLRVAYTICPACRSGLGVALPEGAQRVATAQYS